MKAAAQNSSDSDENDSDDIENSFQRVNYTIFMYNFSHLSQCGFKQYFFNLFNIFKLAS